MTSQCQAGLRATPVIGLPRGFWEMGIDTNLAFGAVRFSLGRETTSEDVQYVKDQLGHVLEEATI